MPKEILLSAKKVINILDEAKITDAEIVSFISVSLGIMHAEEPELYKTTLALSSTMETMYVLTKREHNKETHKTA